MVGASGAARANDEAKLAPVRITKLAREIIFRIILLLRLGVRCVLRFLFLSHFWNFKNFSPASRTWSSLVQALPIEENDGNNKKKTGRKK